MLEETRLWMAVIFQAYYDATAVFGVEDAEQTQARAWLTTKSSALRQVCDYAHIDADYVLHKCRQLALAGWKISASLT